MSASTNSSTASLAAINSPSYYLHEYDKGSPYNNYLYKEECFYFTKSYLNAIASSECSCASIAAKISTLIFPIICFITLLNDIFGGDVISFNGTRFIEDYLPQAYCRRQLGDAIHASSDKDSFRSSLFIFPMLDGYEFDDFKESYGRIHRRHRPAVVSAAAQYRTI
jgi:hypothetical protein